MAFESAGMRCCWQVEIDAAARGVLARHWPEVPRYEDVRILDGGQIAPVDVITAGFPCQDLSVAGKRAGLEGKRSGLFWEIVRIVKEMQCATEGRYPVFTVLENVPGLLSSGITRTNPGGDFAHVLAGLGECGASTAWRILDAQFFGVPQRRRRVFIVSDFLSRHPGTHRTSAAALLFDIEGSAGDSASGQAKGQDVAYCLTASVRKSGDGHGNAWSTTYIADTVRSHPRPGSNSVGNLAFHPTQDPISGPVSPALGHDGMAILEVAATLRSRNHAPGRGGEDDQNLVVTPIDLRQSSRGEKITNNRAHGSGGAPGTGVGEPGDPAYTVSERGQAIVANTVQASAGHHGHSSPRGDGGDNLVVAAWDERNITSKGNRTRVEFGSPANTLHSEPLSIVSKSLTARDGKGVNSVADQERLVGSTVRRLMPIETERLQGWPDVRKTAIIEVWQNSSLDIPKNRASAVSQSHKSLGSAGNAESDLFQGSVLSVGQSSWPSNPRTNRPVALTVAIDLERNALELRSPSACLLSVCSVERKDWSDRHERLADFVRLSALIALTLERTTEPGKVGLPASNGCSLDQPFGNSIVVLSGREIEERANAAVPFISTANFHSTSTTSAVGSSSPPYGLTLETLYCCVVHAIAGFIPETTRATTFFDLSLEISSGWTSAANGQWLKDGPRYRLAGNGVAAPVARWLAERIAAVEAQS